ncbi:DUF3551 domain-containing protein [Bradyrhizobium centrolobii]|uniref:DUF3551 domain-containing protein n=1 Tax=Bradyrhizobium centrolobii TaxID=1505087 RepID=UPI0009EDF5C6|nr:DUF3551 domain-containing protein [Bradyrhizobium centrolobii]
MNRLVLAIVSASSILVSAASISPAASRQYRHSYVSPSGPYDLYCLQGRSWGYPGNCQFATYEQCMATASGTNAYCGINPSYAFARERDYRDQWYPY